MNRRNFIRMVVGGTAAVACGVTVAKEESALSRYLRENIEKRRSEKLRLSMLRNSRFGAYGQYGYDTNGKLVLKGMGADFDGCFFDLRQVPKIKTATLSGYFLKG